MVGKLFLAISIIVGSLWGLQAKEMAQEAHHTKMMPKNFRMVPLSKAQILQKGDSKLYCPKCGMTLNVFYKTNHLAKVNGKIEQFCSMHCLVEEMKSGKKVSDIKVVDNSTLKFIPAKSAWYVVGSVKPATMSKVSKYAFAKKEEAEAFAKKFGGEVMSFEDTLKMAKLAYDKEAKMIAQRQAMMAKKGESIYKKMCKPIQKRFNSASEAKAYIKANHLCSGIKGKPLQAVGLYLKSIK